jgi:hypothetical protein
MKIRRPSPAMVVALIALVMATTGSAVAAVNFAVNAGAVDGKSAVRSSVTRSTAAGRLVATASRGPQKGRIPSRFLDPSGVVNGTSRNFGRSFSVVDNQALAPVEIGSVPGIGTVTAACVDQNPRPGVLDPSTNLVFANSSGEPVNLSRQIGNGEYAITALPNGTTHGFSILGSQPFQLHLERRGTNYVVHGVVRQDGRGTAGAACLVYGYAIALPQR